MMNQNQKNIPNARLRDHRKQRLWTQAQMADILGVTVLTVGRWERGEVFPSTYYVKKLCDLFEKTPEELGLLGPPQQSDYYPLERISDPAEPFTPQEDDISRAMQSTLHQRGVPRITRTGQRKRHAMVVAVTLLTLFLTVVLSASLWSYASGHNISSTTSAPPAIGVSRGVLYQADWSKDLAGWTASSDWHWSKEDGGTITTDKVTNSMMVAPYSLSTSRYAIETRIQRTGYGDPNGRAYGVVIAKTSQGGYVCGVGKHVEPEHFFLGALAPSPVLSEPAITSDLDRDYSTLVDSGWHTYRVEVNGGHIHSFFDGKLVTEVDDAVQTATGQVGIYTSFAFIRIKGFTVLAI